MWHKGGFFYVLCEWMFVLIFSSQNMLCSQVHLKWNRNNQPYIGSYLSTHHIKLHTIELSGAKGMCENMSPCVELFAQRKGSLCYNVLFPLCLKVGHRFSNYILELPSKTNQLSIWIFKNFFFLYTYWIMYSIHLKPFRLKMTSEFLISRYDVQKYHFWDKPIQSFQNASYASIFFSDES